MDKDKKEFIVGSVILTILILLVAFIILFVLYTKEKESMLNIPENKYNVTDFIYVEKVNYSKYNNLFTGNLEIPKITLKNIDENIINEFENSETDILLEIVNSSKTLESKIEESEYNPTSTINIDMDYKIVNNILSVKYILKIKLDFDLDSIIKPLYFNYDIENKKVLSNSDLLIKLGYDPIELSEYLFDNIILKDKNKEDIVIDSISNSEITIQNIIDNRDEYISRINDNLDKLNIYLDGENIFIGYFNNDLINICYLTLEENNYEIIEYKKG